MKHLKKESSNSSNKIIYRNTVNFDGVPLPINNNEYQGCYITILRAIHAQSKNMLSHYHKVYALRLDLSINIERWKEGHISKLLKNVKYHVKKQYKTSHLGYVWVRETNLDGKHHFHLLILIDGHKVNRSKGVFDIIDRQWRKLGHARIWNVKGHTLTTTVDDTFKDAYHHFSYLAKIHTKDQQPPNKNNFNASRISTYEKRSFCKKAA